MRTFAMVIASVLFASAAFGADDKECVASGRLPENATFIGYSRPDESKLRSLALLVSNGLEAYDGRNLREGLVLSEATSTAKATITSVKPFLDRMGKDHCEFPAELSVSPTKAWRIWVSKASLTLRAPSSAELVSFRKLRPECENQGDYPGGDPQCVYAELLAVSDFDANGAPEYWHTTPYKWDTGLTVSELVTPTTLKPMMSGCPGCSD